MIELLDELVGGAKEAAWPLIRGDFGLSYVQIGILMSIPNIVSHLIEPPLGILADVWRRRALLLGGGVVFGVSALMTAVSSDAGLLLLSWMIFGPASGAFVNVSQVTLMDIDPGRREQSMARWSFAGSIGMTAGPLALGAAAGIGLGWRGLYAAFAALAALLVALAWRTPIPERPPFGRANAEGEGWPAFRNGLRGAVGALRNGAVIRWLALLELADLVLDVFFGYLALYFVDVAGVSVQQAAIAVVVWTVSTLVGDFLVIPLLERVPGLRWLRASAAVMAVLLPAFLLLVPLPLKLALLVLLGLFKSGWYSILKAQLYASMPGRGGTAMAVSNVGGFAGSLIPLGIGAVAQSAGLGAALWLLLAAPVALLVALPLRRVPPHST